MAFCNIHILCVDGDTDSRELIEHILNYKEKEYILTTVSTPCEAIDLIKIHSFDLYIFDYQLPEMSGVELCRHIRLTDRKTPVLFFTAKAYPDDRETAMQAGASDYLVKPNDLERFKETIKQLLGKRLPAETILDYSENAGFLSHQTLKKGVIR